MVEAFFKMCSAEEGHTSLEWHEGEFNKDNFDELSMNFPFIKIQCFSQDANFAILCCPYFRIGEILVVGTMMFFALPISDSCGLSL